MEPIATQQRRWEAKSGPDSINSRAVLMAVLIATAALMKHGTREATQANAAAIESFILG